MNREEIERAIRESESLLESVEKTTPFSDAPSNRQGKASEKRREGPPDAPEGPPSRMKSPPSGTFEPEPPAQPGFVSLELSDDEMLVTGHFYPPEPRNGDPVNVDQVADQLEELGVTFGVEWENIRDAIWRCNTEGREILGVPVARGREPEDTVEAHIGLRKELIRQAKRNRTPRERDGQIDYRSVTPFLILNKGTVLARDIPRREGIPGSTVLGEERACSTRTPPVMKPGENISRRGRYYVAAVDGRFVWDKEQFDVHEVLEITGEVDYSTGHIDFPGDVILHKGVKDRFIVRAGGSIFCKETLDATSVECAGDLIANRGIIGRDEATIHVGGKVETRYIENCQLTANGSVHALVGIIHSTIRTTGKVETGRDGKIVGGNMVALEGVSAHETGSEMGTYTEIVCGIDFHTADRLEWMNDKSTDIAFKLEQLRSGRMKTSSDDEYAATEQKLSELLERLQESAQELLAGLDRNEEATITVTGTMHPGTFLEICHVGRKVTEPQTRVCVSLNKWQGILALNPTEVH